MEKCDTKVPDGMKIRSLAMSESGEFDIHDYIPYLINRAAIVLVEQFQSGLQDYELARIEWRVLAILTQRGPTRFGALASLSALEPPTLSPFPSPPCSRARRGTGTTFTTTRTSRRSRRPKASGAARSHGPPAT